MSVTKEVSTGEQWDGSNADIDLGLNDLVSVLSRRKWIVVIVAIVVGVTAFGVTLTQKTTYSSDGSILVSSTAQTATAGTQLLATEEQLAQSRAVATLVIQQLKLNKSPKDVLSDLTVTVPLDTQILGLEYTADTASDAQRTAQAFIDSYLKYQNQLLDGMLKSARPITNQLNALRRSRDAADLKAAQIRAVGGSAATADAEVTSLTDQITILDQKLTLLLSSTNLISTTSAEQANPAVANRPPVLRSTLVGLFAGLLLGALIALLVDYIDRSRRRRRDRARILALRSEVRTVMTTPGDNGKTTVPLHFGGSESFV